MSLVFPFKNLPKCSVLNEKRIYFSNKMFSLVVFGYLHMTKLFHPA